MKNFPKNVLKHEFEEDDIEYDEEEYDKNSDENN